MKNKEMRRNQRTPPTEHLDTQTDKRFPPTPGMAQLAFFSRIPHHCNRLLEIRHGSNERDRSSPTERVSPVILSEAKDLSAERDRPFASLRVTRWDSCNCEGLFFTTEPCLKKLIRVRGHRGEAA